MNLYFIDENERVIEFYAQLFTFILTLLLPLFVVLPVLVNAPNVSTTGTHSVTIEWTAWDPTRDAGDPPVVGYIVYVNDTAGERSERVENAIISHTWKNLEANTSYEFRVAAVREGEGGVGPPSPPTYVTTLQQRSKMNNSSLTIKSKNLFVVHYFSLIPCIKLH